MLLSAEHLHKNFGARVVLRSADLYLEEGDKLGVIGVNGTGKSTLLRLLAGEEEPDGGSVRRDPNVRLNYLSQEPAFSGENTVLGQVFEGVPREARELADYEARTILTKLGITGFDRKVGELSGGQRKRLALASALVHPCDVLILDEPTNHLDSGMVAWLEETLRAFKGALVMVTHDRWFLERVTRRLVEVCDGELTFYEGSYEDYLSAKAEREEMARASERKRRALLRRELQWVLQGPTARGTKSRERLERFETLKEQEGPKEKGSVELSAVSSRLGKKTIEVYAAGKSYGEHTVLRPFDLMLLRDDRIGVIGRNGSGKTTLLRLLAGTLAPDTGEVVRGETVRIGFFTQDNPPMDGGKRVIDYVRDIGNNIATADGVLTASQLLDEFLFTGDMQYTCIDRLSGGEKRRLFLLGILAAAPNVLLLDEPTNDLDIETLTVLEDYLETFPGAVVAVSHDRWFLEKTARRLLAVEPDGTVRGYPGSYTDYLEERRETEKRERAEKTPSEPKKPAAGQKPAEKKRMTYKEQRDYESIEGEIAALESELGRIGREQAEKSSDYVALQALQEEQERVEAQLEEKMERWMYLSELAEQLGV